MQAAEKVNSVYGPDTRRLQPISEANNDWWWNVDLLKQSQT